MPRRFRRIACALLPVMLVSAAALATDYEALLAQGEQAYVAGQIEKALEKFTEAIEADPERWEGYYYSGMVLQENGETEAAIEMYTEALEQKPDATEPLNNLAVAYLTSGQLEKARKACEEALKADPENFEAAYNLGVVYKDMGQLEKAVNAFTESAKLAPADPDPYIDIAQILFDGEDPAGAGQALAEAFARAPGRTELGLKALELLRAGGKNEEALTLARKMAKLLGKGGKLEDVVRVARSLRVMGDPQAALSLLSVRPESKTSFTVVTEMGLCQLLLGDCKQAAKTFDAALKLKPTSTAAMLAKADALCCAGKWCKAKKTYKKFLAAADPGDPNVAVVEAKLKKGKKSCKKK